MMPVLVAVAALQIGVALGAALDGPRPRELRADQWQTVARVYSRAKPSTPVPLWLDGERQTQRSAELRGVLAAVDTLGLRSSDYPLDAVGEAFRAAAIPSDAPGRTAALARADVLLTASFVALVDDLLAGRMDPRKVEPTWHVSSHTFDVGPRAEVALDAVVRGRSIGEVLATLRPDYGAYFPLLRGLAQYRAIERAGGWPSLLQGPTMRPGDVRPQVAVLRRRLAAEKYLATGDGSDTLDTALGGAIAAFQRQHGLNDDGLVGSGTRGALNVPASRRVLQIEANLERLRWLPLDPGERFIVVNVPAFSLYAYEREARVLTMRVVVGDELVSRRTPIFADTMDYVEFGPYWNVPRSIAVNEILPQARRNRSYLARNGYQILRGWGDDAPVVDANTLSDAALFSERYRVRQVPGAGNALGRVKFVFPNDYSVYLHDTPAKSLFDDAHRAHSHGCVRVADPEALAAFVLQGRTDWPRERIAEALAAGRRRRVDLRRGVPVYLVYLTAFIRDGEVAFRDDIYDRDDALLRALNGDTKTTVAPRPIDLPRRHGDATRQIR